VKRGPPIPQNGERKNDDRDADRRGQSATAHRTRNGVCLISSTTAIAHGNHEPERMRRFESGRGG
jgi:hypothetical protein